MLNENTKTHRRGFIAAIAAGAAALGIGSLLTPLKAISAPGTGGTHEADKWFNKLKGSHRVVFDATRPHEIMPFAWPRIFLLTNGQTGVPESDCGVVVVLRHDAIGYAFTDKMWEKYNFAEVFKAGEVGPAFQAPDAAVAAKTRNPFWKPKPGDFMAPGVGPIPIGITDSQKSGVMFCVCTMAMTIYANAVAMQMNLKGDDVLKEWKENLIPGIQMVPSGVWALGRAQEKKCAYIFTG